MNLQLTIAFDVEGDAPTAEQRDVHYARKTQAAPQDSGITFF